LVSYWEFSPHSFVLFCLDELIITQAEQIGYDAKKLREWLLGSEFNHATTTYFLLLRSRE
jgi:hypothetical protein